MFSTGPANPIDITLANGVMTGEQEGGSGHAIAMTPVNEGDGTFNATYRASLDSRYLLSGQLTLDVNEQAAGTGPYTITFIGNPVGSGTWTCTRQ